MNTKLTQRQVDDYQRDGVLIYRAFLTGREVDQMIADITEAIGKMGDNIVAGNKDFGAVPKADTTDF
jgi:hypothetical protein